jgi:citrate lyase subunit beta-like protein
MHARRALLYMPGDDRHKIKKALTLDVDCICMDMEDGVALNRKGEARQSAGGYVQMGAGDQSFGLSFVWIDRGRDQDR